MEKIAYIIDQEGLKKIIKEVVDQQLKEYFDNKQEVQTTPEWLTRQQVADYFSLSLGTVDNHCNSGILKKHYVGGLPRFRRDEVIQALESHSKFQRRKPPRKAG